MLLDSQMGDVMEQREGEKRRSPYVGFAKVNAVSVVVRCRDRSKSTSAARSARQLHMIYQTYYTLVHYRQARLFGMNISAGMQLSIRLEHASLKPRF